jgi:hypothetical protein
VIEQPNLSRRRFLAGLTLSTAVLPHIVGCGKNDPATDLLAQFPKSLDGASSVKIYPAANQKIVLIHLRQTHESSAVDAVFQRNSSTLSLAKDCQLDIRKIVADLIRQKIHPTALYVEGVDENAALKHSESISSYRMVSRSLVSNSQILVEAEADALSIKMDTEQRAALERIREAVKQNKTLKAELDDEIDQISISQATGIKLAADFEMRIPVLETPTTLKILKEVFAPIEEIERMNIRVSEIVQEVELLRLGKKLLSTKEVDAMLAEIKAAGERKRELIKECLKYSEDRKTDLFQVREGEYINRICTDGRSTSGVYIAAFFFGGEHELVDNVQAYNKANPQNQCGLVVITPSSFRLPSQADLNELKARTE